ncbi:MAG TPA: Clp protease N-terminal domain-containing protein [Pseudonocardiaceae bacterium]|nr:Clp protease N-terminal domain-containing protein [Pseudonocardiaceae bacterium]
MPTTGGQPAADALAAIGIDVEEIRRRADETFGPGKFRYPRPPFTARAKRTLKLTLREALTLDHNYMGTGHLVLGLLAETDGGGFKVLTALDVDPDALRDTVLSRFSQQAS